MKKGKTIFAQIMSIFIEYEFKKCVESYKGDQHAINFNCRDQIMVMSFAQFIDRAGLRVIETKLNHCEDLYRSGIKVMPRSKIWEANDAIVMDKVPVEAGEFYLMGKGYVAFKKLYKYFQQKSAYFVTLAKDNMSYEGIESRSVNKGPGALSDKTIKLTGYYSTWKYPDTLRLVVYENFETGKIYRFLTNNFANEDPLTIAELYCERWQIELFFKHIKQHLRIKTFYGTSQNAVYTQIWIIVSDFLMLILSKKWYALGPSLHSLPQSDKSSFRGLTSANFIISRQVPWLFRRRALSSNLRYGKYSPDNSLLIVFFIMKKLLFLATLFVVASCGSKTGSNSGISFNPTPEIKGTLAKYYDVKDVTLNILRDESRTDIAGQPRFFLDVTFTVVKNNVLGIEKEWRGYNGTIDCNRCSSWPPYDSDGKYLWGIGFTIEDEYHNDVVTLTEGETPGAGKLLEYCITPGQEYKYVWNCNLSSVGFDEDEYKVMTKIYNGEIEPKFHILIGQNVWLGKQQDLPKSYSMIVDDETEIEVVDVDNTSSDSSIDWDSILNDFETIVDKYIALSKKVNSGDMNALTEYVSYMEKAQSLLEKLDNADDNMTPAQESQYLKISQKMASAAAEALGD
jgi:hypothetical protein